MLDIILVFIAEYATFGFYCSEIKPPTPQIKGLITVILAPSKTTVIDFFRFIIEFFCHKRVRLVPKRSSFCTSASDRASA